MQLDIIYRSFKSYDHPTELVLMMTKEIQEGVLIATLIGSALFVLLFNEYVPYYILSLWLIVQFALSILRVYLSRKLELCTKKNDPLQASYLRYSIITTALGGFMWGVTSWLAVIYAPEAYTYYLLVIVMGLTAGATTTLGSIFHIYAAFMWSILLMLALSFIYQGDDSHMVIALISVISAIFLTGAGADYYLKMRKIIELSIELQSFNTVLEERVQKEVSRNVEKDIQLMHQSRLAQMGEMIGMIAHQWRQPLHIISTAATDMDLKIQFGKIDDATCLKNIETINTLTQHLSGTIDDFRDFFKVTKERELTSVDEVVNVTLRIVKEYVENKKILITTDLDCSEQFSSYPNELKQVLLNLLKNAEDALLENWVKDASIHIKSYHDDAGYYFEVCDNAGGIDDEVMGKLFEAYFTTKEDAMGTGLGLYMSKKIIEEHCGGTLSVSNKDGGACFSVSLPKYLA